MKVNWSGILAVALIDDSDRRLQGSHQARNSRQERMALRGCSLSRI